MTRTAGNRIIGVAERWDELREAGGEFWKLLNHPATMQRRIINQLGKIGNSIWSDRIQICCPQLYHVRQISYNSCICAKT